MMDVSKVLVSHFQWKIVLDACLPAKITDVPLPLPWSRSLLTTFTSFLVSMYFFLCCGEKDESLFLALLSLFSPLFLLFNSLLCEPESWQHGPKVLLTDDEPVQPLALIWRVLLLRKKVGWRLQTAYI